VKRILTAIVLIALVFVAVRLAPLPIFWIMLSVLALLAVFEVRAILSAMNRPAWPMLSSAGTLAVMAAFLPPKPWLAPVLIGFFGVLTVRTVLSRKSASESVTRLVSTLFLATYLGLTLGHVGGLLTSQAGEARERGEDLLILALVAVYVGDSCAYYGGRAFGRHKMAPAISPSKTWEGAFFGILGSILGAVSGSLIFMHVLPLLHAVLLGVLLGGAGIFGDLLESLLKRAADVKDSGALLPGHGGVFDRIDSLLLAAPLLYWYHRLLL